MGVFNGLVSWFKTPEQFLVGQAKITQSKKGYLKHETDADKLALVLENPAMLKVVVLLCDLFSLGRIEAPKPILDRLSNPNPFQSKRQFLWDYMFWSIIGTAYALPESDIVSKEQNIYWLNSANIEFDKKTLEKADKLFLSKTEVNNLLSDEIIYKYKDRSEKKIKIKDLIIFPDLTNGTGNWLKSVSRLDALYKIVSNSEVGIDAKHDNLDFTRKWLVNGNTEFDNISELPMDEKEKVSIEKKLLGTQKIHAVKTPVSIARFTDSIRKLALDESYMNDLFLIGNLFAIPKDVLEAVGNGSWDNQRIARASVVEFSLQAKGDAFIDGFARYWGFYEGEMSISWKHLSFNQIFENERATVNKTNAETMQLLMNMGADANEISEEFGYGEVTFKEIEVEVEQETDEETDETEQIIN